MKTVRFCNPRFCHRCGVEIKNPKPQQKWCDDCHDAVKAMQQRQSVLRRKSNSNPVKSKPGDEEKKLLLLSRVADWADISYGILMAKDPSSRQELIKKYMDAQQKT